MFDDNLIDRTRVRSTRCLIDERGSQTVAGLLDSRQSMIERHLDFKLVNALLPNRSLSIGQFRCHLTVDRDEERFCT